jgi:hypothetical protein
MEQSSLQHVFLVARDTTPSLAISRRVAQRRVAEFIDLSGNRPRG